MLSLVLFTMMSKTVSIAGECRLDWADINTVMGQTVDQDKFGVEPSLGLGTEKFHGTGNALDAALKALLEKNVTFPEDQIRECLQELYLGDVDNRTTLEHVGGQPPSILQYESPWYLGGAPAVGVPVPDDEEYRPGAEGYTTYINPHNFLNKLPPQSSENLTTESFGIWQSLIDAFGDLFQEASMEDDGANWDNSTELDYDLY